MDNLHPILCSFIPDPMLRRIAEHRGGGPEIRRTALATLDEMERLRLGRDAQALAPPVSPGLHRNVYDAGNTQRLPGRLVLSDSSPRSPGDSSPRSPSDSSSRSPGDSSPRSSDVAVNEAFAGAGWVYQFLFGRNSVDGRGLPLHATVHYGLHFHNALWNGRQMIYGDGDGRFFTRFTIAWDVIAHEHAHAMTQSSANLVYYGQSGALNEHVSDVIAIMVKQYILGQTAGQSNWRIGEGLFTPAVNGTAIRSMAAPGTAYDDPVLGRDPQPAHMSGYVETSEDNGGVHVNSGIPNRAFSLAATEFGGRTEEVVGRIWYLTVIHDIKATCTFQQFAEATVVRARAMFGKESRIAKVIAWAWQKVGLPVH